MMNTEKFENRITKLEKTNKILIGMLMELTNHTEIPEIDSLATAEELEFLAEDNKEIKEYINNYDD